MHFGIDGLVAKAFPLHPESQFLGTSVPICTQMTQKGLTFCVIFAKMSSSTGGMSGRNCRRDGRSRERIPILKAKN